MKKVSGGKKKRRLLKIIGICFIAASAFGLFALWYNSYSTYSQSYKESEKKINAFIARQLYKDSNELTSEDYEKVEDILILVNDVSTLRPLIKLKNLKQLRLMVLDGKMNVNLDFELLAKLKNLRQLTFSSLTVSSHAAFYSSLRVTPKKKWYDGILSIMQKLKSRFSRKGVFDLGKLRKLKNLESLEIGYPDISSFEVLKGFSKFVHLDISGTKINDIKPISGLVNLEYLDLGQTDIKNIDALASLTNLKELNLNGTQVTDISPLAQLTNLQILNLFITQVSDIKALEGLINLKELNLNATQVTDISPLTKLTNLQNLYIRRTNISDEQIEELKKALPNLKIEN